jgi:hypothetical protein
LFKNRSEKRGDPKRLSSLLSTLQDVHGRETDGTEVPRKRLVRKLDKLSNLFTTQSLRGGKLYHPMVIDLTK